MTLSLQAAGGSDVGLVRRRNEDAIYLGQNLFAIADGLGGHIAGDVASTTAINALSSHDQLVDPATLATTLGRAVRAANDALSQRIKAEPGLAGMGTTLVAMLRSGGTAVLANVGDSRAYLLRSSTREVGKTSQITEDHTYEHLIADAGTVPNLPERLSRFIDGRPDGRSPDITTWHLSPGDRFLLCSDGLSTYVEHHLIHAALSAGGTPSQAVDHLINSAIDHGAPDNVTVIVLDVREAESA
ncbi:PP2C family protein-serine/threonine phosphatase [Micromonospora noduli]|uniref:PP2C family protein-serine/threonine phosphatase n=1 Tax=Micromonospora noduli TaxID=709876 RepID=UPI0015EBEA91|nr:protein phosphatase 2C domain-containing protein [Micromonospora noduli]